MKPLRVAHVSDTHLGYRALGRGEPDSGRNQRSIDIERAFEDVVSDILDRDVDLVIHSGDVFDHTRPAYPAIRSAIRQFRRLADRQLPVVVIGGNHDTPRLRTSGSVFSLLELAVEGVTFVAGYEEQIITFEHLDLVVTAVPHGRLTNPEPTIIFPTAGVRNIVVTHGFVPGSEHFHGEPGEEEVGEELLTSDFDYVALGHYHHSSESRPNAWYAGATERFGWRDFSVDPGYLLVELGDDRSVSIEHVPIPTRPMKSLLLTRSELESIAAEDVATRILRWLQSLEMPDGMARVQLEETDRATRREIESIVRGSANDVVWDLSITGNREAVSEFALDRSDLPTLEISELFRQFVDAERKAGSFDAAFASDLLEIGQSELDAATAQMQETLMGDDT